VGPFGVDRGGMDEGFGFGHELVPAEAGVALTSLRVEDPERRPPPRRAIPVAGDQRLRALPDDIAPEADPRASGELEAEPGRLGDGGRQASGPVAGDAPAAWRFEHDQQRLRAPGERRQPSQPIGDAGRTVRGGQPAAGQVQDEQIDRAPDQQRPTDGEALVEGGRGDDDEPLEPDAAGHGLDRVEAARQVEPRHDRALDLGFRGEPQDERGPAARAIAADRDARRTWQATRTQDRVEGREPGRDDAVVVRARLGTRLDIGEWRHGRRRRQGQRPVRDRRGQCGR
jgi:hypothetical protein